MQAHEGLPSSTVEAGMVYVNQIIQIYILCFACLLLAPLLLTFAASIEPHRLYSWLQWNSIQTVIVVVVDIVSVYPPAFAFLIIMWRPGVDTIEYKEGDRIRRLSTFNPDGSAFISNSREDLISRRRHTSQVVSETAASYYSSNQSVSSHGGYSSLGDDPCGMLAVRA
jgi:hypothetical protein